MNVERLHLITVELHQDLKQTGILARLNEVSQALTALSNHLGMARFKRNWPPPVKLSGPRFSSPPSMIGQRPGERHSRNSASITW
jgi:hypothetical protein